MVELGQHVGAASLEGAAELGQFLKYGRNAAAQGVDDRGHHCLAAASVGVRVGGDQALVEGPAQFDFKVAPNPGLVRVRDLWGTAVQISTAVQV